MKKLYMPMLFLLLQVQVCFAEVGQYNYVPPQGVVPDQKTAIAIATAVLSPIYGARNIRQEHLFVEKIEGGVWFVKGKVSSTHKGGVAEIEIAKTDGKIVFITHGK
jgi:NTF2 fold immunity protein